MAWGVFFSQPCKRKTELGEVTAWLCSSEDAVDLKLARNWAVHECSLDLFLLFYNHYI